MCLAQGPQRSDPRSRVKHSTTEPLRSLWVHWYFWNWNEHHHRRFHWLAWNQLVSYTVTLLTHICRMYFSIYINWTSPFPILELLGDIFHFYSNFKRNFSKQTVENLTRRRLLRRLIWFCTVCGCPTKMTLGLYGLITRIVFKGRNAV